MPPISATAKKNGSARTTVLLLSFALILFTRFLPVPAGMTTAGLQVLGIFLGVLLLWLTISIDWPSLLCIAALAFVPGLKMNAILSGSFGNATFAFLMFTFMCTHALSKTPFVRRCAVAFVTSRVAKRGPWQFAILFFASILFLGAFISPSVLFVLYLPIIEEIYAVLHLEKGDKTASMLMMGLVFCCGISSGMTPIAHVFPLMAMGYYQTATGNAIGYACYMAFGIPAGLLTSLLMLLVFRFVLRPDLRAIRGVDVSALRTDSRPMERREKLALSIFGLVVALWVAPGLLKTAAPAVANYIDSFGTAMPPLLGVVAMSVVTADGKPLLDFKEAMAKGVPWGSLIMCAGTLALGAAMTNGDVGLTQFLSDAIGPVASGLTPLAVVLLFAVWATVQTNLSSNMVTVTVVTAVAIPVCLATGGTVSTPAVASLIGMLASYAFATPPAMPAVAIAGASGWTTAGSLMKYGGLMMAASVLAAVAVGYPIAAALMG